MAQHLGMLRPSTHNHFRALLWYLHRITSLAANGNAPRNMEKMGQSDARCYVLVQTCLLDTMFSAGQRFWGISPGRTSICGLSNDLRSWTIVSRWNLTVPSIVGRARQDSECTLHALATNDTVDGS